VCRQNTAPTAMPLLVVGCLCPGPPLLDLASPGHKGHLPKMTTTPAPPLKPGPWPPGKSWVHPCHASLQSRVA
jgi:hypothetical protein